MTWGIIKQQYVPAQIGEFFGGGYFAGYMSQTFNSVPTHALIVAPATPGTIINVSYRSSSGTSNALSFSDGVFNMTQLEIAGITNYPAANFCKSLTIGGYADWYLPSIYEYDIALFNLKAFDGSNATTVGSNSIAVPRRNINYTTSYPGQTSVGLFKTGGSQAFRTVFYWSSTDTNNASNAYSINFGSSGGAGAIGNETKTFSGNGYSARAFRRIAL